MTPKKKCTMYAFTIVELLIVIMIILTISTFSIYTYSSQNRSRKLDVDVSRFVDILYFARQNALNSNTAGFPCPDYSGHRVIINQPVNNSYTLRLCCSNTCDLQHDLKTYKLGSKIAFNSNQQVHFMPSATGIEGGAKTVQIKNLHNNTCIDIEVTDTGLIIENETKKCE